MRDFKGIMIMTFLQVCGSEFYFGMVILYGFWRRHCCSVILMQFKTIINLHAPMQGVFERRNCNWQWHPDQMVSTMTCLWCWIRSTLFSDRCLLSCLPVKYIFIRAPVVLVVLTQKYFHPWYLLCSSNALLMHLFHLWTCCRCGASVRRFLQ